MAIDTTKEAEKWLQGQISAAKELSRLHRIERTVKRENRGRLRSTGCILCGAFRHQDHTCGLSK